VQNVATPRSWSGHRHDTLPRQIEMTYELHLLASGWNDFIAIWTRLAASPPTCAEPDPDYDKRIKFDRLVLREGDGAMWCRRSAMHCRSRLRTTGRDSVVADGNGSGKSSLLASLKTEIAKKRAYLLAETDGWRSVYRRRVPVRL